MKYDLQLFAAKNPKEQIEEYVSRQESWQEGEDPRILNYTKDNVDKALFYFNKYLKGGIEGPDGFLIKITETDFYKHITDPEILRRPQLIKEFVLNANMKVQQISGRYLYISFKPAGYVVAGDICYSAHFLGFGEAGKKNAFKYVERAFKKGGKILWVKD